jgi:predicted nucleotidyltransferase component of viral defense system
MSASRETLVAASAETGFRPMTLEKVVRLGRLAQDIGRQPMLSRALVLKGGTALNLCFGPPRRLSVDLDLNYVASVERERMLQDRPEIERLVEHVAEGQGYRLQWSAEEHAGRKAYLRYQSVLGGAGDVQIDLNFLFRVPLGEIGERELWQPGSLDRPKVQVASFVEVAAGKLVATLGRALPRDIFDVCHLPELDPESWALPALKRVFVALSGVLPRPLTEYGRDRLRLTAVQVREQLEPMLVAADRTTATDVAERAWDVLSPLLSLDDAQREYVERLQVGELLPELLFPDDGEMADRVRRHPALLWKAQNAREHAARRGGPGRPKRPSREG